MERTPSVLSRSRLAAPLVLDVVSVLVFVAIGRDEHDEAGTLRDLLTVAAPFLVGLAVGAGVAWWRDHDLRLLRSGALVLAATVVVGMVLRRTAWDRGTALAFVLVATAFLAVCLLGWRLIGRVFRR